jgi:hypothetical protein
VNQSYGNQQQLPVFWSGLQTLHPQPLQYEQQHINNVEDTRNGFNVRYLDTDTREITRDVAQDQSSLPRTSEPGSLGENSSHFQAATPHRPFIYPRSPIHNPSPQPQHISSYSTSMPSMPPSTSFSYPPLDSMNEMQHGQPYMVEQDNAYQQMPNHEYEHPQQDQPRYPSPPLPSDNPYNPQPGTAGTPDGRMDMAMEPKHESDASSPGRSKPIPKPDREVTKDANGRFYCSWPGCTEEVKDFGRKCEWR